MVQKLQPKKYVNKDIKKWSNFGRFLAITYELFFVHLKVFFRIFGTFHVIFFSKSGIFQMKFYPTKLLNLGKIKRDTFGGGQ